MTLDYEVLRELWRIISRFSTGEVKDMEYVRDEWTTPDAMPPEDHEYVVKSGEYTGITIRRKR